MNAGITRIGTAAAVLGVAASVATMAGGQADAASGGGWATVHAHGGLTIRTAPSAHAGTVGRLGDGMRAMALCRASGTGEGRPRDTTWYLLSLGTGSSGWVAGAYLSAPATGRCGGPIRVGSATAGVVLREGPTTADRVVASVAAGTRLQLRCKVRSQTVKGNALWYLTQSNRWISAAYVRNVGAAPAFCG